MGLLTVQAGEFLSRMSRAAGLKGRVRPSLDDTMVPVTLVMDMTRAPYRLDEQKYFAARPLLTVAAADGSLFAVMNKGSRPIVLEWWRCVNRTAAIQIVEVTMETVTALNTLLVGVDTAFSTWENGANLGSGAGTIRNDIVLRDARVVGGLFPQVGNIIDMFDLASSAGGNTAVSSAPDLDLVIPPGMGAAFVPRAVNVSLAFACQVRVVNAVVGT